MLKHLYGYYNKIREIEMYVFSTSYRGVGMFLLYGRRVPKRLK
jgi:hypothetical protein